MNCCQCNIDTNGLLPGETAHVKLAPCGHKYCVWCYIDLLAKANVRQTKRCQCGQVIQKHSYNRFRALARERDMGLPRYRNASLNTNRKLQARGLSLGMDTTI